MICLNIGLDQAALRGNLFPRVVEDGVGSWGDLLHAFELLGIREVQRYFRICDAERTVIYRQRKGERIYGAAYYSTIARLASTRDDKVTADAVKLVLG
jgi:hypothetical protein